METEKSTKQSMWSQWSSPPNLVTLARIVLVVVFLGLYIGGGAWGARNIGMRWGAAIVFIIAASTDKIDGWMARKYNQVTELGKLLDPIADKLLTLGALVVAACSTNLATCGLAGSSPDSTWCVRSASRSCGSSSSTTAAR